MKINSNLLNKGIFIRKKIKNREQEGKTFLILVFIKILMKNKKYIGEKIYLYYNKIIIL